MDQIGNETAHSKNVSQQKIPLVVDLDGTLVQTDLLHESYFASIGGGVAHHLGVLQAMRKGKAPLKAFLADRCEISYANLPYRQSVLEMVKSARDEGRQTFLATAGDERHARAIADHLGLFDGYYASDGRTNLKGIEKARMLVSIFGERGFDYVGDSFADLPIWQRANRAYTVRSTLKLRRAAERSGLELLPLEREAAGLRTWARALRVHQYTKNILVFIPLFSSQSFTGEAFLLAGLAFVAFSMCASAVYLCNDLVDIEADRNHPRKRYRPLASGSISIPGALLASGLLCALGIFLGLAISLQFAAVLLAYIALTTAYSLWLKRKMLVDVVALALLYIVRVLAGGVAIGVTASEWLLAFCLFIFTSLALIKRYIELTMTLDRNLPDPQNRNYRASDLSVVLALAAASGFNSVTVMALYISSPQVQRSYSEPWLLWLVCPILMYWLARALMMAHRRAMEDDPTVFAVKDRVSRLTLVLVGAIVLLAL